MVHATRGTAADGLPQTDTTQGPVLALDFGGTKVAAGVVHEDRRAVRRRRFPSGTRASEVLEIALELADGLSRERPHTVVVSTPGVMLDGRLQYAPNVDGWESTDLPSWAADIWPGSNVRLCNDVKAAAHAEAAEGHLRGIDPGLYVNLGTGIAAAAVVGGHVVHGTNGLAGEIGYTPSSQVLDGPHFDGTVEDFAGGIGFHRAGIRIPDAPSPAWWRSAAGQAAQVRLDELVRLLSACALLLAPSRVVVGGGMASIPTVIDYLGKGLSAACPSKPEVMASHFGSDASLVGALIAGAN